MSQALFVYGTLRTGGEKAREGETRDRQLASLKNVGKIKRSVPTIYPSTGEKVKGEIMYVNDTLLDELDRYEGVPRLYRRIPVGRVDGDEVQVYVGHPDKFNVPSRFNFDSNEMAAKHFESVEVMLRG